MLIKIKKNYFLILILVILVILGTREIIIWQKQKTKEIKEVKYEEKDLIVYTNPLHEFTFKYPKNWLPKQGEKPNQVILTKGTEVINTLLEPFQFFVFAQEEKEVWINDFQVDCQKCQCSNQRDNLVSTCTKDPETLAVYETVVSTFSPWSTYRNEDFGYSFKYPNYPGKEVRIIENKATAGKFKDKKTDITVTNILPEKGPYDFGKDEYRISVKVSDLECSWGEKWIPLRDGQPITPAPFEPIYLPGIKFERNDEKIPEKDGYLTKFCGKRQGITYEITLADDITTGTTSQFGPALSEILQIILPNFFEFTDLTKDDLMKTIQSVIPANVKKENIEYKLGDLEGDGKQEVIITYRVEEKEPQWLNPMMVGQMMVGHMKIITITNTGFEEKSNDFRMIEVSTPHRTPPKISFLQDLDNDNQKEMIVYLGYGGAYTDTEGVIDLVGNELKLMQIKDRDGEIKPTEFYSGASVQHQLSFKIEDKNQNGKLELVQWTRDYVGPLLEDPEAAEKEIAKEENWPIQELVYEWDGTMFVYSEELSGIKKNQ